MLIERQEQPNAKEDAYSLFLYAIRSPLTRDYYLRRFRIFFNHIEMVLAVHPNHHSHLLPQVQMAMGSH
jgi:hypothetical protein